MKGYYLFFGSEDNHTGIIKKINGQIKVFNSISSIELIPVKLKKRTLAIKIKSRLPFWGYGYDYDSLYEKIKDPDYIYIRPTYVDREYLIFLKNLKVKYPNLKIICELYTYPYDKDFYHSFGTFPLYLKDVNNRRHLFKYIDRFATLTQDDEIFGIKTIKIENGIDLDSVSFISDRNIEENTIRIVSVANMQGYHGFERLINGINYYYKNGGKKNFKYNVVGDDSSKECIYYKDLVKKYSLEKNVIFYGQKTGKDLEDIIRKSDIGLCSLGLYKLGIFEASPLKSREYLAYGLPMITGCKIEALEKGNFPYYIDFPNDSSDIDLFKIEKFYDDIYLYNNKSCYDISLEIRRYAERTVDVKSAMRSVIDFLNEG